MPIFRSVNIICLLIALPILSFAQNQSVIDSLSDFLVRHPQKDSAHIDALNQLAFESYLGDPKKLEFAYQARSLAREINYKKGEAQSYRQIGLVSWAQGNLTLALSHLINALRIAETTGHRQTIADINGNIGLVYQGLGDHKQALDFQLKSLAQQQELKNRGRESVTLNNLGDVRRSIQQYSEAIACYSKALQICEEIRSVNTMATSIRNLGTIYEDQNKFDLALEHYFRSMKITDSTHQMRGMSQSRLSIASAYLKMKQYDRAKRYALESLEISKEGNFKTFMRDSYQLLSRIGEATNDTKGSFAFFKLYSNYKDSVVNMQVASEIASHRLEYETQNKQAEIDLLKKDAQLQENVIARKNTMLISVVLILLLAVSSAIMLFKNYSLQKAANRLLEIKNKEIAQQHDEIATQRDELIALNEEIRAHQEEIMASHDSLAEKNISIEQMNQQILEINSNLEKIVAERTSALEKQNKQLIEYAFINAHKLRAPLARILGLTNLLDFTSQSPEQQNLVTLLQEAAVELDGITRSISKIVDQGLDAYHHRS